MTRAPIGQGVGWLPLSDPIPEGEWVIGKLSGDGRAPAFVGKRYDTGFPKHEGFSALIDEWTGRWKAIVAWAPLPEGLAELPADVRELVIAARLIMDDDASPESRARLDRAAEAFADRVPWECEP